MPNGHHISPPKEGKLTGHKELPPSGVPCVLGLQNPLQNTGLQALVRPAILFGFSSWTPYYTKLQVKALNLVFTMASSIWPAELLRLGCSPYRVQLWVLCESGEIQQLVLNFWLTSLAKTKWLTGPLNSPCVFKSLIKNILQMFTLAGSLSHSKRSSNHHVQAGK